MKPFFVCARARARDSCTLAGEGGGDLGGGYTIITPSREVEETSWTCAGTAQSEDRRVDDSIVASLPLLSGCSCVSLSLSRLSTCLLSLSLSLSVRPTIVGNLTCDLVSNESILYESMRAARIPRTTSKTVFLAEASRRPCRLPLRLSLSY